MKNADVYGRLAIVVLLIALIAVLMQPRQGPAQPAGAGGQGYTTFHLVAAASNNATLIKTGNALLVAAQLSGIGAAPAYLKFYDTNAVPTCQTTLVVKSLMIPAAPTAANGGGSNTVHLGLEFAAGIGICVTQNMPDNDNTSVSAATYNINFDYR